jgi:hypothetical protein
MLTPAVMSHRATLVVAVLLAGAWGASGATAPDQRAAPVPPLEMSPRFGQSIGEAARPGAVQGPSDRLRREVSQRFHAGLLRDGIVLIPRQQGRGYASVEISDGAVSIDGSPVTGRELRARLGADADLVLSLSYLDAEARRILLQRQLQAEGAGTPEVEATEPETLPGSGASLGEPATPPSLRPVPAVPPAPLDLDRYRLRSDTRIRVGGPIVVAEDELVRGPVVAIGGPVTVDGGVYDNVVAIGGRIRLGPAADIRGDVTAVGGTIDRAPGARVRGQLNEIGFSIPPIHVRGWPFGWHREVFNGSLSLVLTAFRMLLVAVLALGVLLVARQPIERIADAAAAEPWKAGAVGLLTQLLVLPILILTFAVLLVSIIGIPLIFVIPPLIVLALLVAFLFGFTGVGYAVGRWAGANFRWRMGSAVAALLVGMFAVWILTLAGRVVSLVGWPVWAVSATLLVVGFLVEYVVWTVGLGAALMTRLGRRPVVLSSRVAYPPADPDIP